MLTLRIMMEVDSGCLLRAAPRLRGDVRKQAPLPPPPTTTTGRVGTPDCAVVLIIKRLSHCEQHKRTAKLFVC